MINYIVKDRNPQLLVISPLKKGDVISHDTLTSVHRNNISMHWISFEGDGNPYQNFRTALQLYSFTNDIPEYMIKMDNDIVCDDEMLDKMYSTLHHSQEEVAYTYCAFRFTGSINMTFVADPFNIERLLQSNYISSISMMKSRHLEQIGGVVTDDKYFRLLDWALWLKFLYKGKIGIPCKTTSFTAFASGESVSARGPEDYKEKALRVMEDFVVPIRTDKL